jgi:hypothetical protein
MTAAEVQSLVLQVLAAGVDTWLGRAQHYFSEAAIAASLPRDPPTYCHIMEGVWSLIGKTLRTLMTLSRQRWTLHLTEG